MWTGEPWLFHSVISPALNLKLLNPRDVLDAAVRAWERGHAPLEAVEGFVRQVLGWREYLRGVYWTRMPDYLASDALDARTPLPPLYWTGETSMRCMSEVVRQLRSHGYAHHIQRLMVAGLFAQLLEARPAEVEAWFMGCFVDSVEWVTAPNVLGMSQYADGGVVGSKPYIATGKYVARQSNYCASCRYRPDASVGSDACPLTTLYWAFLDRHEARFASHPRMALQVKNLRRLDDAQRSAVRERARDVKELARTGAL
jgi:deoxyribodipyrimidine photolyase-related protein